MNDDPTTPTVEQPDATLFTTVDLGWLKRVRVGALLLFWAVLLRPLLPILFGFLLPFLSNDLSRLSWANLLHAAAGVPALIGVFFITGIVPAGMAGTGSDWRVRAFRIGATVHVFIRLVRSLSTFPTGSMVAAYVWSSIDLVYIMVVLVGAGCIGGLCGRFGRTRLARSLLVLAWAYAITLALLFGWSLAQNETDWLRESALSWLPVLPNVAVWIWGLVLLRRFAVMLRLAEEGKCVHCRYLLKGLPERRCPECGHHFPVVTTFARVPTGERAPASPEAD